MIGFLSHFHNVLKSFLFKISKREIFQIQFRKLVSKSHSLSKVESLLKKRKKSPSKGQKYWLEEHTKEFKKDQKTYISRVVEDGKKKSNPIIDHRSWRQQMDLILYFSLGIADTSGRKGKKSTSNRCWQARLVKFSDNFPFNEINSFQGFGWNLISKESFFIISNISCNKFQSKYLLMRKRNFCYIASDFLRNDS